MVAVAIFGPVAAAALDFAAGFFAFAAVFFGLAAAFLLAFGGAVVAGVVVVGVVGVVGVVLTVGTGIGCPGAGITPIGSLSHGVTSTLGWAFRPE
jgi:hypothetical protein